MSRYAPPIRQSKPMGINNLNQLVENQLGHGGFEVARELHDNLQWLHHVYSNLNHLKYLSDNLHASNALTLYIGEIVRVAHSLNDIVTLNDSLPIIKELAPRIKAFTGSLDELNDKINANECRVQDLIISAEDSVKNLEELTVEYESKIGTLYQCISNKLNTEFKEYHDSLDLKAATVKKWHDDIMRLMPVMENAVKNQNMMHSTIIHLTAADAVTTAVFTNDEDDKAFAFQKIKDSESVGNDETFLRERLGYKAQKDNVFSVLQGIKPPQEGGLNVR